MRITAIQKYSIHDGDGIRTTVFFKGCPLRCMWCHNPETQHFKKELMDNPEKCTACGACEAVCPEGAVTLRMPEPGVPPAAVTDRSKCTACGTCTLVCPEALREIAGKEMSKAELLKLLLRDRIFYEESGGGVTFSGGEVLAGRDEEIFALAAELKGEGISLCIDTCGEAPWENFERILPYADVFLYDLKAVTPALHRQYTGVGNERILSNLERLSASGAVIDIRIPLIREVNGTDGEIAAMAAYLKEHGIRYRRVDLLPYHNTGMSKYARLGRLYGGADFSPPAGEELERWRQILCKQI